MSDPIASRRPPLSVIVCDLVCLGLCVWTVMCNACVLLGGTPSQLRIAVLVVVLGLAALAVYGWRTGRLRGLLHALSDDPDPSAQEAESTREPGLRTRAVCLGIGVAAAVACAMRKDLFEISVIAIVFFAASYALVARSGRAGNAAAQRGASEWALWLLALGSAALALTLHESNSDDSFYANLAVSFVDFPDRALLAYDTLHGIPGARMKMAAYGATSIEVLTGFVGQLLGIETLVAYHMVMPTLVALLLPLSLARLLRLLDRERFIWAVLAVLILLALDGGGGRGSFQRFAHERLFQGKAMFVSAALPALLAYGIRFALQPSRVRFALLAAAQIAALGTTVTAFWAAPVLAMTGVVVGLAPRRRSLLTLIAAVASSGYLLALGAYLVLGPDRAKIDATTAVASDESRRLLRAAYDMVLGRGPHLWLSLAAVFVAWPLCRTPLARRFAAIVPLVFFVGLGNPWFVERFAKLTTTTIHWRVLWLLPVPLFIALIASAVIRASGSLFGVLRVAAYALLLTLFLQYASPRLALSVRSFAEPRLKVNSVSLDIARALTDQMPPHCQAAAPLSISRVLPMLNGYCYPLVVKPKYLPPGGSDRNQRERVTELLGREKPSKGNKRWVLERLELYRVEGVVTPQPRGDRGWMDALIGAGFRHVQTRHHHMIWTRKLPASGSED